MKLHTAAFIVLAGVGLTACGGGDDYTNPATYNPNQVPPGATSSTTAYRQYAASLQNSDSATPVDVNNVDKPPTSETEAAASI